MSTKVKQAETKLVLFYKKMFHLSHICFIQCVRFNETNKHIKNMAYLTMKTFLFNFMIIY